MYCGRTVGWIKTPLGVEVGLGPGDIVLDGDPACPQKGGILPNFRPMFVVAKRMDGLRCHLVWTKTSAQATSGIMAKPPDASGYHLMETQFLPPKRGHSPQFSAHVYCGQTAGCIRIPLSTEVSLGPGDIVLHGDPAPPKKGHAPNFRPMSIVAKRSPI